MAMALEHKASGGVGRGLSKTMKTERVSGLGFQKNEKERKLFQDNAATHWDLGLGSLSNSCRGAWLRRQR